METNIRLITKAIGKRFVINGSMNRMHGAERGTREDNSLPSRVQLYGDGIDEVGKFLYLGQLVTADNDTSREVQSRLRDFCLYRIAYFD